MAERPDDSQKTEEPTQKRLDDAHKKGQVATSREVNHWFMMLAAAIAAMVFVPGMLRSLHRVLTVFVESPHDIGLDIARTRGLATDIAIDVALALAPTIAILALAAVAASLIQTGFVLSAEPLSPKLEKISPLRGIKRLFSAQATLDLVKSLVKLCIVGAVTWFLLRPEFDRIERFADFEAMELLLVLEQMTLKLLAGVVAVMAAVAALDLLYQKLAHRRRLRMSREELRDEFKESEGDPLIKSRLRQIRMERARRRMMQEVPKADVVITNPTHFAVALRYDQATMQAPKLVAKGADLVARRIRELAEESHVPVVSNPPLARALYAGVELDQEIPTEHYRAVAEVIGYVMKLRRGGRTNG
jgi:flagellar biosynthetic protein FlhB